LEHQTRTLTPGFGQILVNIFAQITVFQPISFTFASRNSRSQEFHLKIGSMSNRREFEIAFVGLKPGVHEFEYQVDDRFFEEYNEQDFKNALAQVKLKLEKK